MTATHKYLFRTNFDEPPAPAPPDDLDDETPPPPSFGEAELEAARQEALIEGQAQGRQEAARSIEQVSADCLRVISEQLDRLDRRLEGRLEQFERDSLLAALAIVSKLFPALARREELTEIEAVLKDCLQRLHDEPRIVVRLNEAMLDTISPRIEEISKESGFEGRLVLLSDPGFQASDVKVEWADGGAERNSARMWAQIEARLCRSLKSGSSSEPARQEPQTDPTGDSPDDQEGMPQ